MASRSPDRRSASSWSRPASSPATEGSSFGEPGERPISAAKARGRDPRRPPAARGRTDRRRPTPGRDAIHRTAGGLALPLPGAVAVCFDAPVTELFETRAEAIPPTLAGLGPALLAADWGSEHAAEARRRLRSAARAELTISAALLDQRAIAGIGNIWRNETLWHERVDPWAAVRDLDDATLDRLVATAHRLLRASADLAPGQARVGAYRRTGRPCPRCGTPIRSAVRSAAISRT